MNQSPRYLTPNGLRHGPTWARRPGSSRTRPASGSVPSEALAAAEQTIIELREDLGAPLPAGLTGREAQVVTLLAEGLSNADIAARLVVSPRTVDAHLRSIFHKLEVSSRTAAVHEAGRLGLRP